MLASWVSRGPGPGSQASGLAVTLVHHGQLRASEEFSVEGEPQSQDHREAWPERRGLGQAQAPEDERQVPSSSF